MEVHPPEHGIHSLRDFLVHMGTITLGLLIALGLEALVEQAHHRHLLHTAEENLRNELHVNRALLASDSSALRVTQGHLERELAALEAAQARHPELPEEPIHWEWNGPQSAAWDTARDGGAISLMPYEQAAGFALVYAQQKVTNEQASLYVRDLYAISARSQSSTRLSDVSPAVLGSMMANTEHALADLKLLRDYCDSLDRIYARAEKL